MVVIAAALCLFAGRANGQADSITAGNGPVAADSVEWMSYVPPAGEEETYLRYLQIAGLVQRYPWGLRGFSPAEVRRLAPKVGTHPWSRSPSLTPVTPLARLLPLSVELRGNSAFPYGSNDGAVWAGRGLTASATAGLALRAGPVSLILAPTAFIAQNASFRLLDNGATDAGRFADGQYPSLVDRPQRFGDGAYGRLDPGNSTLRADVGPLAAGISTANMVWGPFELYPFVLGTNAPGFAHAFAGTAHPVNIWIGSLHGRVIWGRLEQSEYSPVEGEPTYSSLAESGTRRFASGLVALFEPRWLAGLELGFARFFHSPWPQSGIPASYARKPFESLLKNRVKGSATFAGAGTSADNQLISAFARWVFPTVGLELYTEYGREDHSWDKRDFLQEPDHTRSYGLGMRKTLAPRPGRIDGVTIEVINFQLPPLVRTLRGEGTIYLHNYMRQGHTHRGQLLGANVGVDAAAGATVRWDSYRPNGRFSLALHRTLRQERGRAFTDGSDDPKSADVQYALEVAKLRRYRNFELVTGLELIHELNRDFRQDVTGLSATVKARLPLGR